MLISYRYKFIFIHVFKVAGTSMRYVLKKYMFPPYESAITRELQKAGQLPCSKNYRDHVKAKELLSALGAENFDVFFKFAFVRNPWDWQVSLYEFILQREDHRQRDIVKNMASFEEYLEWRLSQPRILQKDFISDDRGNIIVNFVGQYENIEADFQTVCTKLGITDEVLPHKNKTQRRDYREYYNDRTKNMIFKHFQEDIEMFGYDFDDGNLQKVGDGSIWGMHSLQE